MSVLSMESFIGFDAIPLSQQDDGYTVAGVAARNATAANLRKAGYDVFIGNQGAANLSGGWMIRPDPVNPDRNALVYSNGNTSASATSVLMQAAIRKVLPAPCDALIGGFSLYIPPEFVKTPAANSTAIFRVIATNKGDTSWTGQGASNAVEMFTVDYGLNIHWYTDAPQSSKTLQPGRVNFIEYRIADNELRVWLDDVLVLQKVWNLPVEALALTVYTFSPPVAGASHLSGAAGRWAFGNWYNLVEDGIAPTVRLGPTTRVIGSRPNVDVSVQFNRPTGYSSNAAVAALGVADSPVATLQSANIGEQDVYTVSSDPNTAGAKLIHAVMTKVIATNLEAATHAVRPLILSPDGVEAASMPKPRRVAAVGIPFGTKNMAAVARRPTDNKLFAVGSGYSVFTNTDGGKEGSPWNIVAEDGTANSYRAIAFRADGMGVLAREDGQIGVILPGTDVPVVFSAASNALAMTTMVLLKDGTFVMAGTNAARMRSSTPEIAASWSRIVEAGAIRSLAYSPNIERILAVTANGGSVATSDNKGDAFTNRSTGAGTGIGYNAATYDGTYFIISGQTTGANNTMRSTDGVAWATSTSFGTLGAGTATPNFIVSDQDGSGLSVMGGVNGSLYSTHNGLDWRAYTRLDYSAFGIAQANTTLRGACQNASGDWIMVGNSGIYAVIAKEPLDKVMIPLSGYAMHSNVANVNPATGQPWTPADAAASRFGMRVTS